MRPRRGTPLRVRFSEGLGHAFKRRDRVDLYRPWVSFGLDGIAFRRQFRAVPANDSALPRGARLLSYAISQPKRGGQWQRRLAIHWSTDGIATLFHIQPLLRTAGDRPTRRLPIPVCSVVMHFIARDAIGRTGTGGVRKRPPRVVGSLRPLSSVAVQSTPIGADSAGAPRGSRCGERPALPARALWHASA